MTDSSIGERTPLLEVDGIETCYGLSQVLFGMSLSIKPGEMVAPMGRNGMGKTTTIRAIMGLTRGARGRRSNPAGRDVRKLPPRSGSLHRSVSGSCRRDARSFPI